MQINYCVISNSCTELRAVSFRSQKPSDFIIKRHYDTSPMRNDVYMGKIEQWSPSLGGVFVCLGDGGKAFMPTNGNISLRSGGLYPVTVTRSSTGEKKPRLSMDISFAGARLMLIPSKKGIYLSKKAKQKFGQAGQLIIHTLKQEGLDGIIIREAATRFPLEDILHEARYLNERYKAFCEAARLSKKPCKLDYTSDSLDRFIADNLPASEIYIGDEKLFQKIRQKWHQTCPDISHNIKLIEKKQADAIIDAQMASILNDKVPIGNIGELVIQQTEALTSIDVNAFSGHRKNNRHEFGINLQAVPEIARNLRLRQIGGIIVIDFLKMQDEGARSAIEAEMKKYFIDDPLKTNIYPISPLGLMEMTREKVGLSTSEIFLEKKSNISFEAILLNLIRIIIQKSEEYPRRKIILSAHPEFIDWVNKNSKILRLIPNDILNMIEWKNDIKAELYSPFITVAGIMEPFYSEISL